MSKILGIVIMVAVTFAGAVSIGATADDDPVALVRAYLAASEPAERRALASRIAAHRDYRPSRLREWLHRAAAFPPLTPGTDTLTVDVGDGEPRRVFLVVPEGYRPDRPWPLVYALHPSGEPADKWAAQVQRVLGVRAREFVIASPEYKQNYIAARPPFVPEHPAMLDAVARRVHVAADRVYAFGYSRGGFAAWFLALYYPDRLAGAIAMAAGFDVAPTDDGFWRLVAPNVSHLPVLNVWGGSDPLIIKDLTEQPAGTFAESNRWFQREVASMGLPITNIEVVGAVHNQLPPPLEAIVGHLSRPRAQDPKRLLHTFRHLHQASCYWLEGLNWVGDRWEDQAPALLPAREGETPAQTLTRTLEPRLGRLTGDIDGQTIRVTRRHIGDVVVWLGERTINWDRPVTVEVDGRPVFTGRIAQDAGVALERARSTMDFETLRFAGVRVDAAGQAVVVTGATLPAPVWRSALGRPR
jgi:pimeloyl-ACP methyl ester carboxylesterase